MVISEITAGLVQALSAAEATKSHLFLHCIGLFIPLDTFTSFYWCMLVCFILVRQFYVFLD